MIFLLLVGSCSTKITGRLLTATQVAVYEIWDMVVGDDDAYYFIIASAPRRGKKGLNRDSSRGLAVR